MSISFSRRAFLAASTGLSAMGGAGSSGLAATGPAQSPANPHQGFSCAAAGRSVGRRPGGVVGASQPLASLTGLDILRRGGNAVDAAIAMAAVLNVTEPHMTGIGGDAFAMIYSSKTKKLEALNASGRAPRSLTADHFASRKIGTMLMTGRERITGPGAFDGWVPLLEKQATMKLADLLAPAIAYAE